MEYVCPQCGAAARGASTCASCGLDLDAQGDLPTRAEYAAGGVDAVRAAALGDAGIGAGRPGGLPARFFAGVVDGAILFAAALVVALPAGLIGGQAAVDATVGLVVLLFGALYAPIMLARYDGQTLGKRAFAVRVEHVSGAPLGFGRAFLREAVVKPILSALFVVDPLFALTNRERHTVHDKICETQVVTTA